MVHMNDKSPLVSRRERSLLRVKAWEVLMGSRAPSSRPGAFSSLPFCLSPWERVSSPSSDLHEDPFLHSHWTYIHSPLSHLGRRDTPPGHFRSGAPQSLPPPMAMISKPLNTLLRGGEEQVRAGVGGPQSHVSDVFALLPSRPQRRRPATVSIGALPLGGSFHLTSPAEPPSLLVATVESSRVYLHF